MPTTPLLATSATALACACCYYYIHARQRRRGAASSSSTSTEDADVAAVLAFWFDGEPSELFSTRWFVPPKTAAQAAIDAEVRERFGTLLGRAERGELEHWRNAPRSLVALIVVLDQLSRHVHRAERARVDANDTRALELATSLLERGWERALPAAQLVFALMPLRHQPSTERLATVLEHVEPALARSEADSKLLARFRKQTQLRQSHLQDTIGGGGGSGGGGGGGGGSAGAGGDGDDGEDPFDVLERPDLEASLEQSGVDTEALTLSIATFLHEVGGVRWIGGGATPAKAASDTEAASQQPRRPQGNPSARARAAAAAKAAAAEAGAETEAGGGAPSRADGGGGGHPLKGGGAEPPSPRALLVSLSGGVDSMVLTHALLRLRRRATVPYEVHAVHIDYSNRAESGAEAAYLRRWCAARGVRLEVRVVLEVSRGVTARDEYEKESRRIRFEAYERAMASSGAPAVFFGHHRGDVQENVVSNVMKGGGLLELSGMAAASVVNRVMIWRPMLPHPKADVYAYAHRYGVPYFKDSTPIWSTRGKLRGKLLPLLEEVYGDGFANHLSGLGRESDQCAELLERALFAPFLASLRESPLAVWFDTAAWTHLPLFFWRHALRRVCEGRLGVGLIKEKPLKQMLARLALPAPKRRDGWLALKKETRAILCDTTLVLFRDVFPGHHAGRVWVPEPPAPVGTAVAPPPSSARLGGWRVTLRHAGQPVGTGAGGGAVNADAGTADGADGADGAPPPLPTSPARPVELPELLSGRFTLVLPVAAGYAVGETQKCVMPALGALEARWPGMVTAIPQLVPVGELLPGTVAVTYEYVDCKHPSQLLPVG